VLVIFCNLKQIHQSLYKMCIVYQADRMTSMSTQV